MPDRTILAAQILLLVAAGSACAQEPDSELETVIPRLLLTETQEGFVGVIGQTIAIEPSGEWTAFRVINQETPEVVDTGKLSREQLQLLAGLLNEYRFYDLPDHVGTDFPVNRHQFALTIGEKSSTLALRPGEPLATLEESATKPSSIEYRMVRLIATIQELIASG